MKTQNLIIGGALAVGIWYFFFKKPPAKIKGAVGIDIGYGMDYGNNLTALNETINYVLTKIKAGTATALDYSDYNKALTAKRLLNERATV